MIQKGRRKANDLFHLQIATTYARFELAEAVRKHAVKPTASSRLRVDRLAGEMKDLAPELPGK